MSVAKKTEMQASQLTKSQGGDAKNRSTYSAFGNAMMGSKIAKLQDSGQFYARKMESESSRLQKLREEVNELEFTLKKKRQDIDKRKRGPSQFFDNTSTKTQQDRSHISNSDPVALSTKIKSMEMKTSNLKTKLNESVSKNRELKMHIDDLRREKNIFDNIHEQLKEDLNEKKNQLAAIIEESGMAKKEIIKGREKLSQYKIEAKIDKKKYEKEFQSVFKIIDDENRDQRLREKFGDRQKSASLSPNRPQDAVLTDRQRTQSPYTPSKKSGGKKKNKYKDQNDQIHYEKEKLKEDVQNYEEIFESLKKETNTNSMEEIVQKFVHFEDENYKLFKFINTLRDESEQLNKQKKQLDEEIQKYENAPKEHKEDPKTKKFMDLKDEIEKLKNKRMKHEGKHLQLMKTINSLKISIPIMFERIGCNSEEYTRDLGEDFKSLKDIDEGNMIAFLGIIEKRTNDLLQLYNEAYTSKLDQKNQRVPEGESMSVSNIGGKAKNEDLDATFTQLQQEGEADKHTVKFYDVNKFREMAKEEYKSLVKKKNKRK